MQVCMYIYFQYIYFDDVKNYVFVIINACLLWVVIFYINILDY